MNRRSRHLLVLTVAVVTATVASFAIYRALLQRPTASAQSRPNQRVVVAKHAMAIGTQLTEADLKIVSWPAESPLPNAVSEIKDAVNRGLLATVLENEPITSNKIAVAGAGLSPAIPAGMRAIAVKVNDVIGVAGFVVPKSRVDVVVTIRRQNDSMARTAARNVEVLAAGTRQDQARPESDSKTANAATVVTLMVSPVDAERIALAQAEGEIMLMLRNPTDNDTAATTGVKTADLLGLPEAPAAPVVKSTLSRRPQIAAAVDKDKKTEEPAKPQPYMVEGIRGGKRTNEEVKDAKNGADQKSDSEDKR